MHLEALSDLLHSTHLYGIIDTGYVQKSELESTAIEMCEAGVRVLQLRAKKLSEAQILPLAIRLKEICTRYQCLFVVNDFPAIAAQVQADALHIGQDDGDIQTVKTIVGPDMLIGRSTHASEQALQAYRDGFDYIGFGPLFPTPTKKGRPSIGTEEIIQVQAEVGAHIPVFCIGGITLKNLEFVTSAGAKKVVIVSGILQAEDKTSYIHEIISKLDKVNQ